MRASWVLLVAMMVACVQKNDQKKEEDYPVLETMGYYQCFSHKLWLAGKNQNWELADFYTHELEEVTEDLIAGNVLHDDYNLT